MPSIPALRESKERCKSVIHKIRAWPVFQDRAAAGAGPNIESRRGRLNRNGDVDNGQFADSLVRLMHRRGEWLDEESVNENIQVQASHASRWMLEEEKEEGEEDGWGQSHELSKKQKRELNLRPGGEPIIVAAYHLVRRLVTDRDRDCHSHFHSHSRSRCHCCSNPKDTDRPRHDSCMSQSVRLIDGQESSI